MKTSQTHSGRKRLSVLLLCALLLSSILPVRAAPAAQGGGVPSLVQQFADSLKGSPEQQRKAALAVLQQYGDYKDLVAAGKVHKGVARALDEQLVQMTKETWRKVAVKQGSGLDYVAPVGTLGDRWNNPAYIPGKSDKDFIPQGRRASEAVGDFNQTFQKRFGIKPETVDVNVLDPTDPSSWTGRYAAATNAEKYNTVGGNKWLANELAKTKPNLWRYDLATSAMQEVSYDSVVKSTPPRLTKADALGWFSDNTRFRTELAEHVADPRMRALKMAKYDLRNAGAFKLAGGALSESEQNLLKATEMLRNGKTDRAIGVMIQLTGETDPERALTAYLNRMDELNRSMAQKVVANHLDLMGRSLTNSRMTLQLENELAASVSNLPANQRTAAIEALTEKFGRAKADEIVKLSDVFKNRVRTTMLFDERAMHSFGKSYDELTDAERAVLHGADEVAETFMWKALRYTGYAFSGYAIYNAYVQGAQHGGKGIGAASAGARAFIEVMQAGVPILAIGEVVAQLTAGAVQLGANTYKNDVLETLYQQYKKDPNIDFLLTIQGVLPYYAGGLRQLAIDLKMQNPNLSESEIQKTIGDYFARRLQAEKAAEEMTHRVQRLLSWLSSRNIDLVDAASVEDLTPEEQQAIAGLLENYERIKAQFEKDGIPFDERFILGALWHLYHRAGTPESYEKYLSKLYHTFGKRYPPVGKPSLCKANPIVKAGRNAQVVQAAPVQQAGQQLSLSGSFTDHINNGDCDSPPAPVSTELSAGGRISVTVTGSGVPCTWSLWNSGGSAAVAYEPLAGGVFGPAQSIADASLDCGDEPSATQVEVVGEVPGPGRLTLSLGRPGGCGALTCWCFGGSVEGQVVMTDVFPNSTARPEQTLRNGDRIVTGDNGTARLIVPGFVSVVIRPQSAVAYTDSSNPAGEAAAACQIDPALTVEQGGMRLRTLLGGQPMPVRVGDRTVTPQGTDYEVQALPDGGRVIVWDGSVVVSDLEGGSTTVRAGEILTWPGNVISDIPDDIAPFGENAPYADLPLDDTVPAYYGDWPAAFQEDGLPDGWLWSDPGQDAAWTSPEPGVLEVTAGDGNDLWWYAFDAPLLLRKVTGDFDLQGQVRLDSQGKDLAITEFAAYAPGAVLGALSEQFAWDSPIIDLRLLGGGLYAWRDQDQVAAMGCGYDTFDKCAAAPDAPTWLRLTRRGDVWRTYRSLDGEHWILTGMQDVRAPETLWVGWVFKRKANDGQVDAPAVTTLRQVELVNAPLGAMRSDGWEVTTDEGATPTGDVLALHISQDEPIRADPTEGQWARRLEGDFDVVAQVSPTPWEDKPGETRSFYLAAVSTTGRDRVYAAFNEKVFNETDVRRLYTSDMMIDGGWGRFHEAPTVDMGPSYLRLTRVHGQVTASYWSDCQWRSFEPYSDDFPWPVFLRGGIHNAWEATTPAAVDAEFKLVYVAEGPVAGDLPAWEPATCSVLSAIAPPEGLALPAGLQADAWQSPVALGSIFFDPAGAAYIFTSDRRKAGLFALTLDGTARYHLESDLVAGVNRKTGLWRNDKLMVAIDGWQEGGNEYGGIVEVGSDGAVRPWETANGYGGLVDILSAPGGGLFLADFEQDNIFLLPDETAAETPLIVQGDPLPGPWALAYDGETETLYVLNRSGDWPFGGTAGIYRISSDGAAQLMAAPPEGATNFGDIALATGVMLPVGLYATVPDANRVMRIENDGQMETIVEGVPGVSDLAFNPSDGSLMLVYDGDKVLRVSGVQVATSEGTSALLPESIRPTPAPALTGKQRLEENALFDDFSSDALGWSVRDNDAATTGYEDGAYAILVKQATYWVMSKAPGDFPHTVIEFDAAVASGSAGGMYGVICHYRNSENYDFLAIDPEVGSMAVGRLLNGEFHFLSGEAGGTTEQPAASLARSVTASNHVRARCDDDRLVLTVNGQTEGAWPLDPTAEAGKAALFVYGFKTLGDEGYKVLFDNLAAAFEQPQAVISRPVEPTFPPLTPPPLPTAAPSPTPISVAACSSAVDPEIAPGWNQNRMGCPTAPAHTTVAAVQLFEGGMMVWRGDLNLIYTFYEGDGWAAWPDVWSEGVAAPSRGEPPEGKQAPARGFGFLWATEDAVFQGLGWPFLDEGAVCAVIQEFERGLIVVNSATDRGCGQPSVAGAGWFGSVDILDDGSWY